MDGFERGDLVWGKLKSYPWWPAMVITGNDCNQKLPGKNKLWLFWFGDHAVSEVTVENIRAFKDDFSQNSSKERGKMYKKGIEEILHVIALANKLKFQDASSLFLWAKSGFESRSRLSFKWKNSELPEVVREAFAPKEKASVSHDNTAEVQKVVRKALAPKKKSPISHDDSELPEVVRVVRAAFARSETTSVSLDNTEVVRKAFAPRKESPISHDDIEVQEPSKKKSKSSVSCDDIDVISSEDSKDEGDEGSCIGSCKTKANLTAPHPLFVGNVCTKCGPDIYKACEMPTGKLQEYCVICGRRGTLIHCSDKSCYRSYCKQCIQYFESKKAYAEILANKKWKCYLCVRNPNKKCLIQRRPVKNAITVIADTEAGKNALQRANIKVKNYVINPVVDGEDSSKFVTYSVDYHDFSHKEIMELKSDLVIGSCVISEKGSQKEKKENTVQILRYLLACHLQAIDPISVNVGKRKILVWNNLKKNLAEELQKDYIDSYKVKEIVIYNCIKNTAIDEQRNGK